MNPTPFRFFKQLGLTQTRVINQHIDLWTARFQLLQEVLDCLRIGEIGGLDHDLERRKPSLKFRRRFLQPVESAGDQDAGVREARPPTANERSRSAAAVRVSSFFAIQSRNSVMGGGSA